MDRCRSYVAQTGTVVISGPSTHSWRSTRIARNAGPLLATYGHADRFGHGLAIRRPSRAPVGVSWADCAHGQASTIGPGHGKRLLSQWLHPGDEALGISATGLVAGKQPVRGTSKQRIAVSR